MRPGRTATRTPYLFVYGTLMSQSGHPMARQLERAAARIGMAHIMAEMYDFGWYPAIVLSDRMGARVHGEVFRLHDPARALPVFDRYEGITRNPKPDAYLRVITLAVLHDGQRLAAWVYTMNKVPSGIPHVSSGRYFERNSG